MGMELVLSKFNVFLGINIDIISRQHIFLAGDYAGFPGCGLLRLHSTYRHDLKIYASDEGRVQMTAAAFAKVFNICRFVL